MLWSYPKGSLQSLRAFQGKLTSVYITACAYCDGNLMQQTTSSARSRAIVFLRDLQPCKLWTWKCQSPFRPWLSKRNTAIPTPYPSSSRQHRWRRARGESSQRPKTTTYRHQKTKEVKTTFHLYLRRRTLWSRRHQTSTRMVAQKRNNELVQAEDNLQQLPIAGFSQDSQMYFITIQLDA